MRILSALDSSIGSGGRGRRGSVMTYKAEGTDSRRAEVKEQKLRVEERTVHFDPREKRTGTAARSEPVITAPHA